MGWLKLIWCKYFSFFRPGEFNQESRLISRVPTKWINQAFREWWERRELSENLISIKIFFYLIMQRITSTKLMIMTTIWGRIKLTTGKEALHLSQSLQVRSTISENHITFSSQSFNWVNFDFTVFPSIQQQITMTRTTAPIWGIPL